MKWNNKVSLFVFSGLSNSLGEHHGVWLQGPAEDWGVPLIHMAVCSWYFSALPHLTFSSSSKNKKKTPPPQHFEARRELLKCPEWHVLPPKSHIVTHFCVLWCNNIAYLQILKYLFARRGSGFLRRKTKNWAGRRFHQIEHFIISYMIFLSQMRKVTCWTRWELLRGTLTWTAPLSSSFIFPTSGHTPSTTLHLKRYHLPKDYTKKVTIKKKRLTNVKYSVKFY